jgi:hypothetical protein
LISIFFAFSLIVSNPAPLPPKGEGKDCQAGRMKYFGWDG